MIVCSKHVASEGGREGGRRGEGRGGERRGGEGRGGEGRGGEGKKQLRTVRASVTLFGPDQKTIIFRS